MANAPKPDTARKPPIPSAGHADIGDWIRRVWLLYLVAGVARPAVAQVDQPRAQQFFKEAQALCERDGGRLWGVSICAPMVIVDRRTQTIATSQPAPAGARPRELGFVNAPIHWGGATWGAYMWDDVAPPQWIGAFTKPSSLGWRDVGRVHVGRRRQQDAA